MISTNSEILKSSFSEYTYLELNMFSVERYTQFISRKFSQFRNSE